MIARLHRIVGAVVEDGLVFIIAYLVTAYVITHLGG